jgi:hypothetical protein
MPDQTHPTKEPRAEAVLGDDYKKPGSDHPTFGITITNAWLDLRGRPQPHGNMIEVYRTKALRDRVLHLLQKHGLEDASPSAPVPASGGVEAGDWRNDPTSDERWNAGCDFAMTRLCNYLNVDTASVRWDAATETVEGDVSAVIGNILEAHFGEDWSPTKAASESAGGDVREATFEVHQDGSPVALASGPRDRAYAEAMHYASVYGQDGPVEVFEHVPVPLPAPCSKREGA